MSDETQGAQEPPRPEAALVLDLLVGASGARLDSGDPLQMAVIASLGNVARDYASDDPTERARAVSFMNTAFRSTSEGAEHNFATTTFAPEELHQGLMTVANELSEENAATMFAAISMPQPARNLDRKQSAEPLFAPQEEVIAVRLIGLGLGLSRFVESQAKLLRPNVVWAPEHLQIVQQQLAAEGHIQGTSEEQAATVNGVLAKIYGHLETAIDANRKAIRQLGREAKKL